VDRGGSNERSASVEMPRPATVQPTYRESPLSEGLARSLSDVPYDPEVDDCELSQKGKDDSLSDDEMEIDCNY